MVQFRDFYNLRPTTPSAKQLQVRCVTAFDSTLNKPRSDGVVDLGNTGNMVEFCCDG